MTTSAPRPAHGVPLGATILADGNTRFRLWILDATAAWIGLGDVHGDEAIHIDPEPDG